MFFYLQPDAMDCGPTCLRMVSKPCGRTISLSKFRSLSETTRKGSSLKNLADAAGKIGFRTTGVKVTFELLRDLSNEFFMRIWIWKSGWIFR
jgi:ATP-binding cassette subfamily B protein